MYWIAPSEGDTALIPLKNVCGMPLTSSAPIPS